MFIKVFIIAIVIFFAIDMVWLGFVANKFYQKQIGFLMKSEPNRVAAVIFYLIFVAALTVFVIIPAIEKESAWHAVLYGGFFGLATYATFDLTSLALIKDWPLTITIVDLIWGTTLSVLVSVLTYIVALKFVL